MVTAKDAQPRRRRGARSRRQRLRHQAGRFPVALARIRTQLTARRDDPLTGLPNRVLFMDRLDAVHGDGRDTGDHGFAVLFLDVDRFKVINDSLGHLAGDELLVGSRGGCSSRCGPPTRWRG